MGAGGGLGKASRRCLGGDEGWNASVMYGPGMVKSTENEATMGRIEFDGTTQQHLLQRLLLYAHNVQTALGHGRGSMWWRRRRGAR